MVNINCGNCGSTHESVAEVKQCHIVTPPVSELAFDGFEDTPHESPREILQTENRPTETPDDPASRGPDALGRSALVSPGDPAPDGWEQARRVRALATEPTKGLLDDLHRAWVTRERLVIELEGDFTDPTVVSGLNLWSLDPALELSADRLKFLLTTNTVDHRGDHPTWGLFSQAIGLGATAGGDGDVILADGTPVWLDGGPFGETDIDGTAVLHAVNLEFARLKPTVESDATSPPTDLAPDQQRAVEHRSGPARIIAPAGSGKTRVLTERARHLVKHRAFPTSALTLVAFNKRAQLEMQERTTDLGGLRVRTLNALGLAIVRGTAPFVRSGTVEGPIEVITEREVRRILDGLLDLRRRANVDQLAAWLDALTAVRLGLANPKDVEQRFGGDVDGLAGVVKRYRSELERRGVVDFDEQVVRAIEVLLADPTARQVAQKSCRAMLVDEFQDLTPAHMLLIRILAAPSFDVFGVGDDDQTIYGYTGAKPDWLIDFARWFPEAKHHALEVNYRCPPAVVKAAATLLTHNRRRVDKVIASPPDRASEPGEMAVLVVADTIETTRQHVEDLVATGSAPDDVVVLTRVNAALAPVQVALAEAAIPVEHVVGTEFAARSGVRAVLAWLRIASGGRLKAADIEAAARRPSRGLSPRAVEWMAEQRDIDGLRRLARRLKERDSDKVDGFADDVNLITKAATDGATTDELIEIVRDEIGLAGSLDALDSSRRTVDRSSHGDDLAALLALGRLHQDVGGFEAWLLNHLSGSGHDPNGVRLSTIHRVKGREWPHVLVVGVDAGRLPHRLSSDIAEERRVFHVGITRSKSSTTVIATVAAQSRFIGELESILDPSSPAEPEPDFGATTNGQTIEPSKRDEALRERLKAWRLDQSKSEGVPAYVIFNDKTLDDLLARRPTNMTELGRCHGIGPAKLDRFGDELVGVLEQTDS